MSEATKKPIKFENGTIINDSEKGEGLKLFDLTSGSVVMLVWASTQFAAANRCRRYVAQFEEGFQGWDANNILVEENKSEPQVLDHELKPIELENFYVSFGWGHEHWYKKNQLNKNVLLRLQAYTQQEVVIFFNTKVGALYSTVYTESELYGNDVLAAKTATFFPGGVVDGGELSEFEMVKQP